MSYILDALRKADSQRERGTMPGLHTQVAPPMQTDEPARRQRPQALLYAVVGLTVLLLISLGWHLSGSDGAPATSAAPSDAVTVATAPPQPAPPPRIAEPAPPLSPPPVETRPPDGRPAPRPPSTTAAPAPVPVLPAAPAAVPTPTPAPPQVATAAPPLQQSQPKPSPASVGEPRLYAFKDLPEEIRRNLPTLNIGGAMYSDNAANRMLIINGQLFHEGDKPTPDLALEEIKLKSAVLSTRGYRFSVSY